MSHDVIHIPIDVGQLDEAQRADAYLAAVEACSN